MIFEKHVLKGTISKYIESILYFKDYSPEHSIERLIPTGHVHLIFELDGFARNTYDTDTLEPNNTYTKVWVSGMHKNHISISAHQNSEMFVIQFKPFGAYPFFHFPMQEINEKIVSAQALFGNEILELREAIMKIKTPAEKFDLADTWLLGKFQEDKTPSEELLNVLEKLQTESAADYPVIVENYPNTQKHLIDQFKKYIGLTPKIYQRILRFNEVLQQINKSENIEWSQIAYQCAYSDQSHFIKEFKHFSGFNPQKFIQQDFHKDQPNFFPLDKKG